MSVSYASTSFGSTPTPSSSRSQSSRPSRHQRHPSRTSSGAVPHVDGVPSAFAAAPAPPPPAHNAMRAQYDQIGSFFGGQRTEQNTAHSQPSSHSGHGRGSSEARTPPPYSSRSDIESLPSYSKIEAYDAGLNRKLFMYGFVFFPLWIVGIIAPFVKPLHDPTKDNRSKEDQEADDASMRQVEMRWAKRCAIALITFTLIIIIAVVVGVTVANHQ
ncbi:hypothetical protein M0805_003576 [Coniferiporia weirii]|nr:hypothetical protein M0805_003576 [Coniferiporia weirii]